jgi:hypothetical protein
MNLTTLVDVAIGLALVYIGASLFVTIANEYVSQLAKLRAKQLTADLRRLIDSDDAVALLKTNPAFAPFFEGGKAVGGTYVDPTVLARQLIGGLRKGATGVATMGDLVAAIAALPDSNLRTQLLAMSQVAANNVDKFVENVSGWVERSLTMLGEVYKKRMQVISLAISLAIAFVFNLDTISVASHLYRDKETRDAVTLLASDFVQQTSRATWDNCTQLAAAEREAAPECAGIDNLVEGLQRRNETLGRLPIGWPVQSVDGFPWWLTAPLGWLLTAMAISLGATFWFDVLNRLVNIRHGMKKPEVSSNARGGGASP